MVQTILDYGSVALLGALVGLGELVSRYRDEPGKVAGSRPALFYIFLNAAAALLALFLARSYGWTFGAKQGLPERITQILIAGTAAMAFFRTSLFTVRVGGEDVGIGPSGILMVVLQAADRAVDRRRAEVRDQIVAQLMAQVSFDKAYQALPAHCFALMQNLSREEQAAFGEAIKPIRKGQMTGRTKSLLLGLALLNLVGDEVLRAAVNTLGPDIREPPA